jgi:putative transcriptional regulator
MSPQQHLHVTTLMGHAAGALSPGFSAVVMAHLSQCARCRGLLDTAEALGGQLIEQQHGLALSPGASDAMRERLAISPPDPAPPAPSPAEPRHALPLALQAYFGPSLDLVRWRWIGPGIHRVSVDLGKDEQLTLLRVAPGRSLPEHTHQGRELTLILSGAYVDALGRFGPGDVADLDAETEHQPVTTQGAPCICVAATDAPLRFTGWIARSLQRVLPL